MPATAFADNCPTRSLDNSRFARRPVWSTLGPRVNLTRYHGVFAPNHRLREQVTPARRGRRHAETADAPARHVSMTWAQRLKRVFKIDIETCEHGGGAVKVIASIEDPAVIKQIREHLDWRAGPVMRVGPVARAAASGITGPDGKQADGAPRRLTHGREAGPDTRHDITRACLSEQPLFPHAIRPARVADSVGP